MPRGKLLSLRLVAVTKAITIVTLVCPVGLAQHQHSQGSSSEKPVALYSGLGTWTHPIATRVPEAQKYFDQGLTLMYGFNRYEARRSFRKALDLDPSAAMAQWGLGMALGPYLNMDMDPDVHMKASCTALQTGLATKDATITEQAWLEAAAARCPDGSHPQKYVAAMRALAARFPDDPDAQTLFAESLLLPVRWRFYPPGGQAAEGVEEAQRVLEAVLRRHPNHPGANHFYIHAVESSPTPERAIPSAQRLMGIVPSAGHMVHMPGHIWLVLGDYEAAVAVNQRAAQVDQAYFAQTGVTSSYYMNYLHNIVFVVYARAMQGHLSETRKAMDTLRAATAPMNQIMPGIAEMVEAYVWQIEARMAMWDELLAAPQPNDQSPFVAGIWHFGRALALFRKGRIAEARQQQQQFEEVRTKISRDLLWGPNNKLADVTDVAAAVLNARLESDPAASVEKWLKAVDRQDRLIYCEPPPWYYPVRESLGAALLISGDAPAAELVFREGLRRSPNNGRLLFGLRESLRAQHKAEQMRWVEREFQRAWKGADLQLRTEDL